MDKKPQHHDGDDHQRGQDEDDSEEEKPVGEDLASAGIVLGAFEQSDVLAVRFPSGVEGIAEEWNGADQGIDADVGDHASDGDARQTALPRGENDEKRSKAAERVAEARK